MKRTPLKISGLDGHKLVLFFTRSGSRGRFVMITLMLANRLAQMRADEKSIFRSTVSKNR